MPLPKLSSLPLATYSTRSLLVAGGILLSFNSAAFADGPNVVTTIKPLHSIASAVMMTVGTPQILIDGATSPHGFSLKPSQAAQLQEADVVFWIGPELTPALEKPIAAITDKATAVELIEVPGIEQLSIREGGDFEAHDDDEEEQHAGEHHHHGSERDPHIWLNPENGIVIAQQMAETLAENDPANAETYLQNAAAYAERIKRLEEEIAAQLAPLANKAFIVFHDAYHHFEHHFDVEASGSVTVSPESLASADRIREMQEKLRTLSVSCVFQEPQFDSKLVGVVLEGSSARKGVLDPLGAGLNNGPDLYPELLSGLSKSLVDCLGSAS